jgi:CCR4-NOT transcription complex subunit 2
VGLDPNDFPALGSAPANNNNNSSSTNGNAGNGVTTSYASQAGTGVPLGGAGGTSAGVVGSGVGGAGSGNLNQLRDFTPDDFPALGGQSHTQGQTQNPPSHPTQQNPNQENHPHPPGLNGFQHTDHLQHRQNLLGALGGNGLTPGMLNLAQARSVHPGFQQGQTEAEKQQQRVSVAVGVLFAGSIDMKVFACSFFEHFVQSTVSGPCALF